jgi:hypothetical protein
LPIETQVIRGSSPASSHQASGGPIAVYAGCLAMALAGWGIAAVLLRQKGLG